MLCIRQCDAKDLVFRIALLFLSTIAVLSFSGCGVPEKATDYQAKVNEELAASKKACDAKDAKAARAAATAATQARDKLKTLADNANAGPEQTAAAGVLAEAEKAASEAGQWAQLAEEEQQCADILNGLRAKAYRTARQAAFTATLEGLALACDKGAKYPPDEVPENLRSSVELAVDLATSFGSRRPKAGEKPDLALTAQDLRAFSAKPPDGLSPALAISYAISGHAKLALMEYEAFSSDEMKQSAMGKLVCCFIYRSNGFDRMVDRELATASKAVDEANKSPEQRKETEALLYLAMAFIELKDHNLQEGDRYLALAFRASPNNPVAVFLTGERFAADGKPEAAAESLEKFSNTLSAGPEKELADAVRDRAREMRDAKGPPKGFLSDPAILWGLVRLALKEADKTMPEAKTIQNKLESANVLSDRIRAALP